MNDLKIIEDFIQKHHILTLSTLGENGVDSCSAFYAYDPQTHSCIIASDKKTTHIQNILQNNTVAVTIHLDTTEVGKIEGLQAKGDVLEIKDPKLKKIYFKRFSYALALRPTLWQIKLSWLKYTSNRLGFGKKLIVDLQT